MSADLKSMCKVLRLAYVHDTYEDIPYQNTIQFLEDLFQKELQLSKRRSKSRTINKKSKVFTQEVACLIPLE